MSSVLEHYTSQINDLQFKTLKLLIQTIPPFLDLIKNVVIVLALRLQLKMPTVNENTSFHFFSDVYEKDI